MTEAQALYAPPWRDSQGREYGPSMAAYTRQLARHKDWSYRPTPADEFYERLRAFMRPGGVLRDDLPESEVRAYLIVVEQRSSTRYAARLLGVSRESVRSYLKRLKRRMG